MRVDTALDRLRGLDVGRQALLAHLLRELRQRAEAGVRHSQVESLLAIAERIDARVRPRPYRAAQYLESMQEVLRPGARMADPVETRLHLAAWILYLLGRHDLLEDLRDLGVERLGLVIGLMDSDHRGRDVCEQQPSREHCGGAPAQPA